MIKYTEEYKAPCHVCKRRVSVLSDGTDLLVARHFKPESDSWCTGGFQVAKRKEKRQ